MAAKVNPEVTIPESTGAVDFDGSPVTTQAVADPTSTAAVPVDELGTSTVQLDGPVVITSPTPGPVTTTVSWLDAKAVTPKHAAVDTAVVEPEDPKVETK